LLPLAITKKSATAFQNLKKPTAVQVVANAPSYAKEHCVPLRFNFFFLVSDCFLDHTAKSFR